MKKRNLFITLLFSSLVCLFFFQLPPNDQVEAATVKIGVVDVNSGYLNVRSGAGKQFKVLGKLKKGLKVTVYSQTKSGWSEIRYKKVKAFVSTPYLRFYSKITTNSAKSIIDHVIALQRKTWEKNYTKEQIIKIMNTGYTTDYISKYFKQQFRKDSKDHYGNQLYHVIETEIWGYAIDEFDWKPEYDPKKPNILHYFKDGKEYLTVSQFHLNEESGDHTSSLYIYRSNSKSNWKVYNYITKY